MKTLKNNDWDTRYSSATHNLITDFFEPALSKSKYYYRIAGYFSSASLVAAFRGVSAFVKDGKKMYLIIGSELSEEDVTAMNRGLKKLDDILFQKWESLLKDIDCDVIRKRFEILSWLIANDKLDIRIGINKDKNGNYLKANSSKFHEKILIFEDYEGNRIQIDGSINETWKAWKTNRESFCVHKSWIQGNDEFIISAKTEFDKVWNNYDETCEVLALPEAIHKKILSILPKVRPEIEDERDFSTAELEKLQQDIERPLRKYQKEAILAWKESNHKGILEMATGTGKTYTALRAIKDLDLESKCLLIGVPQRELANQWESECKSVFKDVKKKIILCYSGTGWENDISRKLRQSQKEGALCILIAVLNTMRSEIFMTKISKRLKDTYLIIDEVHEIGSYENRKTLKKLYDIEYRLGLSATPQRAWDDDGNEAITDYFSKEPVFVWDMKKAINPPEGYERCLSPYKYYIHDCHLERDELEKYEILSKKIKSKIAMLSTGNKIDFKDLEKDSSLKLLLIKRADIIKECKNKLTVLENIIRKHHPSLKKCLVYCNDKEHMAEVTKIILKNGFSCRKFYGDLDTDIKKEVFKSFKDGDVQFIIAIKCLDQGIDLPLCDSAIILTSSRNPREYIQRRGRILRLHKNKEFSIVHDILVLPHPIKILETNEKRLHDFEANILKNQIERIRIFMDNSLNKPENDLKLLEYGNIIVNCTEG